MTIDNLKDLRAIIALCRKTGVQIIKVDNVELQLSDYVAPPKRNRSKARYESGAPNLSNDPTEAKITSDSLTPEQLLEWSLVDQTPGDQ